MKRNTKILLVIACLGLTELACRAATSIGMGRSTTTPTNTLTFPPTATQTLTLTPTLTHTPTDTSTATQIPLTIPAPRAKVILRDDFSSSKWGTGTNSDSSIEYANNALRMIVHPRNWFVWSTPNARVYQNVHLEVTVINNKTDSATAFGIICNRQKSTENFYYFAITPAGQYAIAKAVQGQSDLFITNDDKWASSDAITQNASSYRIGADCGNGVVTLYVDGQQIDSVSDTTYTSGGVALFTWSGDQPNSANVSFDDFVMTELP